MCVVGTMYMYWLGLLEERDLKYRLLTNTLFNILELLLWVWNVLGSEVDHSVFIPVTEENVAAVVWSCIASVRERCSHSGSGYLKILSKTAEDSVWADPRKAAGIPFTLKKTDWKTHLLNRVATNLRAVTWSSIREIRGEITTTKPSRNTAGYW